MAETGSESSTGWRISKACQECRKRKIRCDGLNPCKTCQRRNTSCVYRDFVRQRRKKHESDRFQQNDRAGQDRVSPNLAHSPAQNTSTMHSVSATHMASPSCQMQLYYGPTSHFSLMQHIYRDLIANPTNQPAVPLREVEQAGAGLDVFSFRRIFFGTPDTHEGTKGPGTGDAPFMFLPYELAKMFLFRYLSTLYYLMPYWPQCHFEQCLEQLYNFSPALHPDTLSQAPLLLVMAIGSLGTEHYVWGDILFERVKASLTAFDEVVNLQTVQISLLMICSTSPWRPNSAFLHLGAAVRKAFAAGLHKDPPSDDCQTRDHIEERQTTLWCLYYFETWFSFHVGRPTSMSLKDLAIEYTQDPFIRALVHLTNAMSRSANEIYGRRHESLLQMWKVAGSIAEDLRSREARVKQSLGLGVDSGVQTGSLGARHTIFTTMYYNILLLTFRPFLVFRGHWQRDRKRERHQSGGAGSSLPIETPSWLNEACDYTLTAAQKTILHLYEASNANDHVRQLRYHGYFIASACFTLIYDIVHDGHAASVHLPLIYASLQTLSTMRAGDPVTSTITAIQTALRKINPSYEWSPSFKPDSNPSVRPSSVMQPLPTTAATTTTTTTTATTSTQQDTQQPGTIPHDPPIQFLEADRPDLSGFQPILPSMDMPGLAGSNEDLFDFTKAGMGWDFDFSTMDLETFFSIDQSMDPILNQGR